MQTPEGRAALVRREVAKGEALVDRDIEARLRELTGIADLSDTRTLDCLARQDYELRSLLELRTYIKTALDEVLAEGYTLVLTGPDEVTWQRPMPTKP
jgi:hypothetical protein